MADELDRDDKRRISVKLPSSLREKVEKFAEQEDRSLSGAIRILVQRAVNQSERAAA
jgi:metal-responsive CopG/Arc/MetJ family transcriptional regulator